MYSIKELTAIVNEIVADSSVKKVILVGSYAQNTATNKSDIDLVLEGDNLADAYWDILFALEDRLTVPVDLMTVRGLKNSLLKDSIMDGGLTLYEA